MVKKLLTAGFLLLMLTGCWDLREIEQIGFVIGLAFDPLEKADFEKYKSQFKKETTQEPGQLFKSTFQVVIPSALTENGGGETRAFFNISSVARTNFKNVRHISARRSRRLNFEHLKVIIINKEIAQTEAFVHLIDLYIRDNEMRRTTFVFVSEGKGEEILEHKLPLELMPSISLKMIQENNNAHHGMTKPRTIGDLSRCIIDEKSYIIPRVSSREGKDIAVSGAGVFSGKTNQLVGWLGEQDIEGFNLVRGETENAIIEGDLKGNLFVVEVDNMDTVIEYKQKDGVDHFNVEIKVEGFFTESWLEDIDIGEKEGMEEVEEALEKEIERLATNIVQKMQNEFSIDIFEFFRIVQKKNYRHWKEVKDNWDGLDGYFSKAVINVSAKAKIRHYMTKEQLT